MMILSLSTTLARRSAPALARRSLSVQTLAKVQDLESALQNLHWTSVQDNVKEIRQLMDECKTNHAVRVPDAQLEEQVRTRMGDIGSQLSKNVVVSRDLIEAEIFGLKQKVKSELYGRSA